MRRRFTILAAAFTLLTFLAIPMGMRGQEVTLSFASNTWGLPEGSSNGATQSAAFTDTETGYTITLEATTKYYINTTDGYLLFGKDGSTLTLPAFAFDVDRIEVVGRTGASASVVQNIYVGEEAVSTATTGATSTNIYNISSGYQSAGNIYVLKVTSNHNTQVTSIKVYEVGGTQPTTYTVTFDAGQGTFVGSTNLPNTSNTVTAGNYTLPTATRDGYTFDGWMIAGDTELYNGTYTVSGNVDFTASYTEDTPPAPGDDLTLTFNLSSNPGNWPTTNSNTLTDHIYTLNNVNYTFALLNAKCNNGYLMIYYVGAVGLPAIEGYKLTQVVASNSGGCSTSTKVGISSSASQANYIAGGEIQTWSTTSSQYTYNLTSTEENTMYYLYVTNKNAQVTSLTLTYEAVVASSVATPVFNPASGTEFGDEGLQVSITCATEGVDIYYTLDGSEPDDESNPYNGPISLTETTTIKAIAYDGYDNTSAVATATYTYVDPNAPGTENNPYTVAQARAAIDAGTGTQGVYATGIVSDIPTAYSTQFSNITFNMVDEEGDEEFLQAYRCGGDEAAEVTVGDIVVVYGNLTKYNTTYEFGQGCTLVSLTHPTGYVEAPTFNPAGGTYDVAQTVTISCANADATIYYTLDGSEPTDASTQYTTAINVTTTTTIKAIAYVGTNASAVTTATYNIVSLANISDITEVGTAYEVQGTVVATNSRGFVMGDGTGYVYYYKNGAVSQSIGDMVKISGTTGTYGQIIQFTNAATVTEATTSNYNGTPAATVITEVPDYTQGYHLSTYVEFEGALTKTSGNYLIALGEAQIQISYPTTDQGNALTALKDKNVHVKGYFTGINSSNRFTVMLESIEEVEVQHEEYTLTVSNLVNVNTYVFDAADESEMLLEGEGSVQILDGTMVMISVDVEEGYAIESLMVDGVDVTSQIDETGAYTFTMPTHDVTITATAVEIIAPTDDDYVRITSLNQLTDGSIVVIASRYNEDATNYYAMKNTISGGKAQCEAFVSTTSDGNEILPASIVDNVNDYYWVVNLTENGYTFTNANGDVISYNSSSNFNMNGTKMTWNVERGTSGEALVPSYEGFKITNVDAETRCIAFRNTETGVFGPYSTQNINGDEYNFFLDFFVQTAGSETVTQTIELTAGWNWISTYIDLNEVNGIEMLKEALGDYATMIQTYSESADYFGDGEWAGLEDYEWTNGEMIMVEVVEDCTITLAGPTVDPSTVEIEIYPEWNWIGFPVATETPIEVALAGFEPEDEDAIQGYAGTSDYMDEWLGEIMTLVPGQGYMYLSNSTEPKTLVFQTGAKARRNTKSGKLIKK